MFNNTELNKASMGNLAVWCNATELGLISGDYDFDDGTGVVGIKAAQSGDAEVKKYQKTANCKIKLKLITADPEKVRMALSAISLTRGTRGLGLRGGARAAVELRPAIWTLVPNAVGIDGTIFNENTMHPKAIQVFRGVVNSGYKFKMTEEKAWELELEIEGMPDFDRPDMAVYEQSPNISLPAPAAQYVEMLTPGVGYTVLPTSITCTGLTGSTFTSQIVNGRLNVIMTNAGTALASALGTFLPLTITGGTSTTAATAQVYVG